MRKTLGLAALAAVLACGAVNAQQLNVKIGVLSDMLGPQAQHELFSDDRPIALFICRRHGKGDGIRNAHAHRGTILLQSARDEVHRR